MSRKSKIKIYNKNNELSIYVLSQEGEGFCIVKIFISDATLGSCQISYLNNYCDWSYLNYRCHFSNKENAIRFFRKKFKYKVRNYFYEMFPLLEKEWQKLE
jgi:hypothetical protein